MNDMPVSEIGPPFENLRASQGNAEALQRILAETDDNPDVDLSHLKDTDRNNIMVSFILRAETETGLAELPDSLRHADYCFFDSQYEGSIRGRRGHDIVQNMAFDGRPVLDYRKSTDPDGASSLVRAIAYPRTDLGLDAFVGSQQYQGKKPKPVVRTLGYGQYDHLPTQGPTSAAVQDITRPMRQVYQEGLFTKPNEQQLHWLHSIFSLTVPELQDKNAQLQKDVSMMIAGAVRRHPETQLHFAIALSPRHDAIVFPLARLGKFVSLNHTHQRLTKQSKHGASLHSAYDKAEQEAADAGDRKPKPESLARIVLSDYLYEMYFDRTGHSDLAQDYTRTTDSCLRDEEVSTLLSRIDDAKAARLPRLNLRSLSPEERRRKLVTDLIWDFPAIASLRP